MTRTCEHSDAGRAAAIKLSNALSPPKSRGRRVRRSTPGRRAAVHRGVADYRGEDAPTGCQGGEILEHAFVPLRRGGRQRRMPSHRVRQSCCPFSYLEAAIFRGTSTDPGRPHPGSIDSRPCFSRVKWPCHIGRVANRSISARARQDRQATSNRRATRVTPSSRCTHKDSETRPAHSTIASTRRALASQARSRQRIVWLASAPQVRYRRSCTSSRHGSLRHRRMQTTAPIPPAPSGADSFDEVKLWGNLHQIWCA